MFNTGIAGLLCPGAYTSDMITSPLPTGEYTHYVPQVFALILPFPFGVTVVGHTIIRKQ